MLGHRQSGGFMEAKATILLFTRNSLSLKKVKSWAWWHVGDHIAVFLGKSGKSADIPLF